MMLTPHQAAYEEGYDAYYDDDDVNPYSYDNENELWCLWCAGQRQAALDAYCEDEGK